MIIRKNEATEFEQPSVVGRKYSIENLVRDKSFVVAKLNGEHGERVSTDVPRLYYIIDGSGIVVINGEESKFNQGDLIIIPPQTRYNYFSTEGGVVEFMLFMEAH